jgi:3-oxoacid CoA-transferase subunit B
MTRPHHVAIVGSGPSARDGGSKIVSDCTLPLTGVACVDRIITDLAVLDVTPTGLMLSELAPGVTPAQVHKETAAPFEVKEEIA